MKLQDYIAYLEELTAFKKKHDGAHLILGKALAKAKTIIVPDDRLRELVKWLDGVNEYYVPEAVVAKARSLLNDVPTAKPPTPERKAESKDRLAGKLTNTADPEQAKEALKRIADFIKYADTPAPEDNCAGITSRPSEWAEFKEWKWQKKYGTPAPDRLAAELKAWIKTEQDDYAALGSDGISSNARCNLLEELRIKIIRYDTPNTTVEIIDPNPCNVDPNAKELKMNTTDKEGA